MRVGAYDAPVCTVGDDCHKYLYRANVTSDAHAQLARQIAAQSAVLLKNVAETLPIKDGLTIAVVGSACDSPYNLDALTAKWDLGNYYVLGGSGWSKVDFDDGCIFSYRLAQ
jgi:beta-glucosidase-like glycosyl hydrolase